MWPFNRRSVAHRTFGQIHPVRNGKFWKAQVSFESLKDPVELQINAGDQGPAEAQEKLYLLIQSHFRKVLQVALKSVHVEFQRVSRAQPAVPWPVVSSLKEQLCATPLTGVWLEDSQGHRFVLSFRAEVDKEQHFHVFFHHWKVESVAAERF
jgi:hypothetical protein